MGPSSFLTLSNHEAAQQLSSPQALSAVPSRGSEATPAPAAALVKKQLLHLEEAKGMCPEGHELSESYKPVEVQTPGKLLPLLKLKPAFCNQPSFNGSRDSWLIEEGIALKVK